MVPGEECDLKSLTTIEPLTLELEVEVAAV